jgi:hypothetical protein
MKNIKSIEQFLFESKSSAKKRFLDRGLVSEEVFDRFLEVDITPTKKFIEKMCEFFVAGEDIADIVNTFEKVISLSNKQVLNFDISLIKSIEELQSLISEKEDYKSRSERNFKAQKGAEVTYEDGRFVVLYIKTEEASQKYGKDTMWCISAETGCAWDDYEEDNTFYFVIDKTLPVRDSKSKFAVQFRHDGGGWYDLLDRNTYNVIVYNSLDSSTDVDLNYLLSLGVPESAFKYDEDGVEDFKFCYEYGILGSLEKYIDSNGQTIIDVVGDVDLSNRGLVELPVTFSEVTGDFDCSNNKLTTLKGCPAGIVGYSFLCNDNHLTSLEGCPDYVGGIFDCSNNELTSLEFAPEETSDFDCYDNLLTDLKGSPKKTSDFDCSKNKLTSLEGHPLEIYGTFRCDRQRGGVEFSDEFIEENYPNLNPSRIVN